MTSLQDERNSAALYAGLAALEKNPQLAEFYRRLAETETRHAKRWEEKLIAAWTPVPPEKLTWRTSGLLWAARIMGPSAVAPSLATLEDIGGHTYTGLPEAGELAATE